LETARSARVKYADARVVLQRTQHLEAKNGDLAEFEESESLGIGVRVLRGRGWGFAATNDLSREGIDRCVGQALALAKASASVARRSVRLAEQEPSRARWQTPVTEDPFTVPTSEKIDLLVRCSEALRIDPRITVARAEHLCAREEKVFASTEGSEIEQTLTRVSFLMQARATEGGEMQQRTWPVGLEGLAAGRGYEAIRELDPIAEAPCVAGEALELLSAPVCPPGRRDLIIGGDQLALQIHESCGHPVELDRALGHELNFAGYSFLTPDMRGSLRYGSPIVNLAADAVTPGSVATFGFDDEGVPAQTWDIVRDGVFVGYLDSRETAAALGLPHSHGCMRASGWNRVPIVRMVNVSLQPGDSSLDEIIADTRDGVLMETNRSWSIDHLRLNFQFGTEIGWEVKDGRRGRMLRSCTYQGRTPEFWGSCDRIAGPDEWQMWGVLNCGKGQPGQVMTTGHGCAPARFRDVNIGVT
ncbi:TldD/PmbA family protein, partial [Candidatus Sumerlaeota bacterium]|nr:TldD/PmbA family protein [Candidatus Sumerlaeota bacterium]